MIGNIPLSGRIVIGHRVLQAKIPGYFVAKNRCFHTLRIPALKGTAVKVVGCTKKVVGPSPAIGDIIASAIGVLLFLFPILAIPLKIRAAKGISDIGPCTGHPKEPTAGIDI